jgi:hypothetical protein
MKIGIARRPLDRLVVLSMRLHRSAIVAWEEFV